MTESPEAATIEFTPLSNGLDFILTALEQLSGTPDARKVKYGILHMSAGLELIFKERLRKEHWSLVFENIESANEKDYQSGEFISVSFDKCRKRICDICGVKIPDDKLKRLYALRKKRNLLEHFGITDSLIAVKATAAKALGVIIDFIIDQLSPLDTENDKQTYEKIRELLSDFDKFVIARWADIQSEVESAGTVVECPRCSNKALVIDGGVHCLFCRYREESDEAAEEYISSVLGISHYEVATRGGEWPLYQCPHCKSETLVAGNDESICFQCGEKIPSYRLHICCECNEPFLPDENEPMTICNRCFSSKVNYKD